MKTTTRKMGHGYSVLNETGKTIGFAFRNGMRNTAGRGWTYKVYGIGYEGKTNSLKNAAEAIVREIEKAA